MSDNMPDFDNMSQEEIMAWMETLAKRQGASEGFTTSADMDIAEIDPNTVVIDEPGYVPYGQEKTQPMEAQSPAPKAPEKPATVPPPAPPPPRAQTPPAPPVSRPPAPPAASSQERIAPARPQPTPPAPAQPSRVSPPPAPPVSQPQRPPVTPPPPPAQTARPPAPPAPPSMSERPAPTKIPTPPSMPAAPPRSPVPPPAPPAPSAGDDSSLAWLESLAADQGEELFNLDLSDIPSATHTPTAAPEAPSNPMTWLEDLARSQVAEPSLEHLGSIETEDEEESEKLDPFAENVNPMEWLETLAKRQGAKDEELTTGASLNIPQAQAAEVEQEDYQPFSFDTPPTRRSPEPAAPENPADFLNSLAGEQGYSESGVLATQPEDEAPDNLSMTAIEDALSSGTVTREQMQKFLDETTNQMAETPEDADEGELDLDAPLAPAEIPDWLSDLMPAAPPPAAPTPTKPIDQLFEAPASVDMPDWLRQDVLGDASASDIDSIFEESEPLTPVDVAPIIQEQPSAPPIEVDTSDPWVEAFDEEYEQGGEADVNAVPEWYEQNVNDPARIAAVEGQTPYEETIELEDAPLPAENGLTAGQPQGIPEWVTGFERGEEEAEPVPTNVFEEMPDWLKEVESSVSPQDVPDWLVETISVQDDVIEPEYDEPVVEAYTPPAPVVQAPPPKPVTPAPAPRQATEGHPPVQPPQPRVAAPTGPVAEVIERARDREQSGDLEGALAEYESMIRTNSGIDAVVEELSQLVKSYKTTPAVYRVLGDGLMRQGKLQQALNTYREALNQI
ncbi:MAG TPA: hypothetical protein VHD90_13330 [Phototrophicaceae bacterium]|nr:hypothetical protein [Phototrophicaceae bacterium]